MKKRISSNFRLKEIVRAVRWALFAIAIGSYNIALAVNINEDSAEVLAGELNGIGPKLADAIVQYRTENGPFSSEQELMNVSGIGPVIIDRNRDKLEFTNP